MKPIFTVLVMIATLFSKLMANEIIQRLDNRMQQTNSLVCVGLDPDIKKMPLSILDLEKSPEDNIFNFLTQIIDITAEHSCCYKVQKAFFDQYEHGHLLLNQIVAYIHKMHPEIPVFIDCKIGDIDNTMSAYMNRLFVEAGADGVVINPYMGDDVFIPFLQDSQKTALVLIQTSNTNAKVVQDLTLKNGKKLWEEILDLTLTRWNENKNMIVILSSNSMDDYSLIRKKIPQDMPILLAGIGSQGGNPEIMKQVLNANKRGVFINSSRGILYPYEPCNNNWKAEVLKAIIELKQMLNKLKEE